MQSCQTHADRETEMDQRTDGFPVSQRRFHPAILGFIGKAYLLSLPRAVVHLFTLTDTEGLAGRTRSNNVGMELIIDVCLLLRRCAAVLSFLPSFL